MNLNKYTKAELISKFKKLDNQNSNQGHNQSYLHKIVDGILKFKSLILKVTLMTFIIKWIRKYSLVVKFWHLFTGFASAILGISLIDIYALNIIEWIKDTSIYKWYSELLYPKEKSNNEFQFPKRIVEKTETNETRNVTFSEWINRNNQEEITEFNKDESIWSDYKHIIIISTIVIGSVVIWYYSDEIKDGFLNSFEWIKNYFSRPPTDPSSSNSESISTSTTQSSEQNIKPRWRRFFKLDSEIKDNSSNVSNIGLSKSHESKISEIELIDDSSVASSSKIDKGKAKEVLTSPSLESLNNKVEEAWSESEASGSQSPDSVSSSETIKGTPFIEINRFDWLVLLSSYHTEKIKTIENICKKYGPITVDNMNFINDTLLELIKIYDIEVIIFDDLTESDKIKMKTYLFYFRTWIAKYYNIIIPNISINTIIGNINDNPTFILEKVEEITKG